MYLTSKISDIVFKNHFIILENIKKNRYNNWWYGTEYTISFL